MWPCDELATCPECLPAFALRQLGDAPADPGDPECRRERVLKMDGWTEHYDREME